MPLFGSAHWWNGVRFRSKAEIKLAQDLADRGIAYKYEEDRVLYTIAAVYIPDFELPGKVYVEFKGYLTPQDRKKLLAVKRCNPALDLRLVFQRAGVHISKGKHSQTYGQWATKHGFLWAEGTVPDTWLLT